jgi:predicted Zn-dependent protease
MINKSHIDKIAAALREELKRSLTSLKVPGHPKPYFISYLVRDIHSYNMWGRYGALCQNQKEHKRSCYADVRVGSYKYDHVVAGGLTDNPDEPEGLELADLPLDDNQDALRFCLWRLTDARYRDAVKKYHEKRSRDISYLDESKNYASFLRQNKAVSIHHPKRQEFDEQAMVKFVKDASVVFKEFSEIKNSYVEFSASMITKMFSSTEGVERVWSESVFSLNSYMWLHTKKCNHDLGVSIHVPIVNDLPDLKTFRAQIKKKIDLIYKIEKGDRMTSYAGPVLLAPQPAGLFIHEAVGHRLEGTRLLSSSEGKTFKDKLGSKIMHSDLSIYDDPTIREYEGTRLVGSYPYDDEGVEAKRVCLVKDGVLKDFLNTRSPFSNGKINLNGHARNQTVERPISRMGNMFVESKSKLTFSDLKKLLVQEIVKRKLPYGIILYEVEGGETGTEAYNFQAFLGDITVATKIYPNGKEELVWGVDFVGTPLSTLSQILAVGGDMEVDNSFCGAESGTIPVSTVSPSLLIETLELQAKQIDNVTQYVLPLPWWDK